MPRGHGGSALQHRIETTVGPDGVIVLHDLPFQAGETVEIVVKPADKKDSEAWRYPLRGTTVIYHEPFEPVAETDWRVAG